MKEKAAYLRGLIEGLGIDETTKEGKVIKAMSELLGELAEAVACAWAESSMWGMKKFCFYTSR